MWREKVELVSKGVLAKEVYCGELYGTPKRLFNFSSIYLVALETDQRGRSRNPSRM